MFTVWERSNDKLFNRSIGTSKISQPIAGLSQKSADPYSMDPQQDGKSDPDSYRTKKQDPDPNQRQNSRTQNGALNGL